MEFNKKQKFITSAMVVLILLSGYIYFSQKRLSAPTQNSNTASSTTQIKDGVGTTPGSSGYTIEQVSIDNTPKMPMPDLNRPIIVSVGVTVAPEAKTYAETKVKSLQTTLKSNAQNVNAWIDLAIAQKGGGDYEGAILSFKYASYLAPTDYVSLSGLANLYAYFLRDNAQAEIYYKKAIEKGPMQEYLYGQLIELYIEVFKDIDKARLVVDQGLAKLPNSQYLLSMKASLK